MSYAPTTDFLALLRQAIDGVRIERIPGLDWAVAAMARAGMFTLATGQTAPTVNQSATVWVKPSSPSWVAEGVVYLWDASTAAYELATPSLWISLFSGAAGYSFQSVTASAGAINPGTSLLAVRRAAPVATALLLPSLTAQWRSGRKLQIVDFSTSIAAHTITLTTPDGATIMQQSSWQLLSTAVQLSGLMLQPSPDLNSWVIAP